MSALLSTLNTTSSDFQARVQYSHTLRGTLENIRREWATHTAAQLKRRPDRIKLTASERVSAILDSGSPFLELSPYAAHNVYDDNIPRAGIVTGIGLVNGVLCLIAVNDPDVKGGTYYPLTVKKHLRA
ncbi:MAG: carboxyl transferase domain-containing protein, partial [Gammaproteobacteria bacterium]